MKILSSILALATCALAQASIPVHLGPSAESPQIGELEAISLAVTAEWPTSAQADDDWSPIYYRGVFEVYLDNNDIAKDLSPKPGSIYYLEPTKDAAKLAIATKKDKANILKVDTWFCKMQLETIIVGYIPNSAAQAQDIATALPSVPTSNDTGTAASQPMTRDLEGLLQKTGPIAKARTGLSYKLTDRAGKQLALLDLVGLPERIQIAEYLGQTIQISGELQQAENGNLTLLAHTIRKVD